MLRTPFVFLGIFVLAACGVKGKPLPPLTPPVLGRGEPNLFKATKGVKIKKKSITNSGEPDWDEPEDFPEDSNP